VNNCFFNEINHSEYSRILNYEKEAWHTDSFFYNVFYWREKKELDHKVLRNTKNFFQERYKIQEGCFEKIWDHLGEKIWTKNFHSNFKERIKEIDLVFQAHLIYHGKGISRLTQSTKSLSKVETSVKKIVQALLHGQAVGRDVFNKELMQSVFVSMDPNFSSCFRQELQEALFYLAKQLPENPQQEVMWRGFLGNILSLISYSYPEEGQEIIVPFLEDSKCALVSYKVSVLNLTSELLASPIKALGLTPQNDKKAPPILSFIGTTYPAGDGFAATLFSDFSPGYSVGELAFKQGKKTIARWLNNKSGVHLVGTSLGGALAMHTLKSFQSYVERVDVYNPPGFYPKLWKDVTFDDGCEVNVFCQAGDLVSSLGSWPVGNKMNLYKLFAHQPGVSEGVISSHAIAFTGCKTVTILREDPAVENKAFFRKLLTFLHRFVAPLLVFIPLGIAFVVYKISDQSKISFNSRSRKDKNSSAKLKRF